MLRGRTGFGDAIYLRALARSVAPSFDLTVETSWPWLFRDLAVACARAKVTHTRKKALPQEGWSPARGKIRRVEYRWEGLPHRSILAEMESAFGARDANLRMDLPPLGASPIQGERIAVIRPVTLRSDYPNPARNPDPAYIQQAARILAEAGYLVVSIGRVDPRDEPLIGEPPEAHAAFNYGEIPMQDTLALIAAADVVVGGPGWIVPACLASGTPLVVIAGGQGGCNGPQALVDPRVDSRAVRWVQPDGYCRCTSRGHDCPKVITDFEARFTAALYRATAGDRRTA